jgi:hypothetical protein
MGSLIQRDRAFVPVHCKFPVRETLGTVDRGMGSRPVCAGFVAGRDRFAGKIAAVPACSNRQHAVVG